MGAAGGARLIGHARGGDREAAETRVPAQTGSHRAGDPVRMAGTEPALRDTGLPAANFKTNKVEKLSLELRKPDTREGCSRSHTRSDHARVPDDGPTQATPGVEALGSLVSPALPPPLAPRPASPWGLGSWCSPYGSCTPLPSPSPFRAQLQALTRSQERPGPRNLTKQTGECQQPGLRAAL